MSKVDYSFYKIPKVVFNNSNLSPCAKLLFAYLISREKYHIDKRGYSQGAFVQCYLRTLANQVGKSIDSVRKNYIPELIREGLIDKKNIGGKSGDKHSTKCMFRILWDTIKGTQSKDTNQTDKNNG